MSRHVNIPVKKGLTPEGQRKVIAATSGGGFAYTRLVVLTTDTPPATARVIAQSIADDYGFDVRVESCDAAGNVLEREVVERGQP